MKRLDFNAEGITGIKEVINNTALVNQNDKDLLVNLVTGERVLDSIGDHITIKKVGNYFVMGRRTFDGRNGTTRFITVYDPNTEKIICEDYIEMLKSFANAYTENVLRLKNPETGEVHMLNANTSTNALEMFQKGFKGINYIGTIGANHYYSVDNSNDKTQLCLVNAASGSILDSKEYDGIRISGKNTFVFKEGKKEFYVSGAFVNGSFEIRTKGPLSDKVWVDESDSNIIYCKNGKDIDVYNRNAYGTSKVFTIDGDDLSLIDQKVFTYDGEAKNVYIFDIERKEKHGILKAQTDFNAKECDAEIDYLTDVKYTSVGAFGGEFVMNDGLRQGILFFPYTKPTKIEAQYYSFGHLFGNTVYFFEKQTGLYDIICIEDKTVLVSDCTIEKDDDDVITITKDGKIGLIWDLGRNEDDYKLNVSVQTGFDWTEKIADGWYKTVINHKCGVVHKGKEILPNNYSSVVMHFERNENVPTYDDYADNAIFELMTPDGEAETILYDGIKGATTPIDTKQFKYVEFFYKFVAYKDDEKTYICNYNNELLYEFEGNVKIDETSIEDGEKDKVIYVLDDEFYDFKNDKFIHMPSYKRFGSIIEGKYGYVVIDGNFEDIVDDIASDIEYNSSEEDFDEILLEMYNSRPELKEKYPTLIKK